MVQCCSFRDVSQELSHVYSKFNIEQEKEKNLLKNGVNRKGYWRTGKKVTEEQGKEKKVTEEQGKDKKVTEECNEKKKPMYNKESICYFNNSTQMKKIFFFTHY